MDKAKLAHDLSRLLYEEDEAALSSFFEAQNPRPTWMISSIRGSLIAATPFLAQLSAHVDIVPHYHTPNEVFAGLKHSRVAHTSRFLRCVR